MLIGRIYDMAERAFDPFQLLPEPNPLIPPTTSRRVIFKILAKVRWPLAGLALTAALITLIDTLILWHLGGLVDLLANAEGAGLQGFYIFAALVVAKPVVGFVYLVVKNQSFNPTLGTVARRVFHRHVNVQDPAFFRDAAPGRVAAKVSQTGSAFRQGMRIAADHIWSGAVSLVLTIGLLITMDLRLAILVLVWLACYVFLLKTWIPRNQTAADQSAEALSELNGTLVDVYDNFALARLFAWRRADPVEDDLRKVLQVIRRQTRISTSMVASVWSLNAGLLLSVAGLSVWLWSRGMVSVGAVAGAVAILTRLQAISLDIMFSLNALSDALGTLNNSTRTIARRPAMTEETDLQAVPNEIETLTFRDVSATHAGAGRVLHGINLTCTRGETLFLLGPSGHGKSTMLALVARFLKQESGEVALNGVPVGKMRPDDLRARLAVARQEPQFFNIPIRDNLMLARDGLTEEDLWHALEAVEMRACIASLVDGSSRRGLSASLGGGAATLSQGQLQRLALARILLSDAPVVLLDEPTSALDPETEARIWPAILAHLSSRVAIVVTHRFGLLPPDARIAMIEHGRVVLDTRLDAAAGDAAERLRAFLATEPGATGKAAPVDLEERRPARWN